MRLLNTTTYHLETFSGPDKPPYAILSHTWGEDEVLFDDIQNASSSLWAKVFGLGWRRKSGASKVIDAASKAFESGFKYIWIDTCCIDKSSSAELSEAINSMYRWYQQSAICYAYLSDVPFSSDRDMTIMNEALKKSQWFRRGWTDVVFFDKTWHRIGARSNLVMAINAITRVDIRLLQKGSLRPRLGDFSVHTRMTWAYKRETTRPEDRAYSMMGIFDVSMPLIYGEGTENAFDRLQAAIIKGSSDQSILLHTCSDTILAKSPDDFSPTSAFQGSPRSVLYDLRRVSAKIATSLLLYPLDNAGITLGIIESIFVNDKSKLLRPAILLLNFRGDRFIRLGSEIHKVGLNASGQAEVVGALGWGLDQQKLQRKDIELYEHDNWLLEPPLQAPQDLKVYLRPIVHDTESPLFEYAPGRNNTHEPFAIQHNIRYLKTPQIFPDFRILAAIHLHHREQQADSVAILIFDHAISPLADRQSPEGMAEVEAETRPGSRQSSRHVFPEIVNLSDWLSVAGKGDLHQLDLKQVRRYVRTLPKINSSVNLPFPMGVGEASETSSLAESALGKNTGSTVPGKYALFAPDGSEILVSLEWSTFLEEEILYFKAEVSRERRRVKEVFQTQEKRQRAAALQQLAMQLF